MSVQTYEPQPQSAPSVGADLARWIGVLPAAAMLADKIANTEFVPRSLRGKPDAITAAILYGDEIGVGAMQALASISVVDGRPTPSAELMRALIFREGHEIRIVELSGTVCAMEGRRAGSESWTAITWTLEMARLAGLLNKSNWKNYPRAMLLARCSSELARIIFPDVIKGLGHVGDDAETVEEFAGWAEAIAPTPAASQTIERRRPPRGRQTEDVALPQESSSEPTTPKQAPQPLPDLPPVLPPSPRSESESLGARSGLDQSPDDTSTQTPPAVSSGDAPRTMSDAATVAMGQDGQQALPLDVGGEIPPEEPPSRPIGSNMIRTLMSAFERIDIRRDDRDLRLAITSAILHRPITTSNELSIREVSKVIGVLNDLETGLSELRIDALGHVSILGRQDEGT